MKSWVLALFILVAMLAVHPVISALTSSWTIHASGTIATVEPPLTGSYKSEIRGIFVHAFSLIDPDWYTIADTLVPYDVNVVVIEWLGNNWAHYPSSIIGGHDAGLDQAVQAFHSKGIEVYAAMNVMLSSWEGDGQERSVWGIWYGETTVRDINEVLCPTKQASRQLLKALVEEVVTTFDIDGFMFDYIRYEKLEMCYCSECEAKFKQDTGLTDAIFPSDVAPGGRYHNEFTQWRIIPVNELVRDMRDWMLAIKPNLKFSAAVWRWPAGYPTYWVKYLGQDATFWVKEGWLDWVAPMIYTDSISETESVMSEFYEYMVAVPEGKTSLVPFIDTCVDAVSTPGNFAERVSKLRELGADGWIVWRYGGPGDGYGSSSPDIRDYLAAIDRPPVWSLGNILYSIGSYNASITWSTSMPATSKVEYSDQPLFSATRRLDSITNLYYWDIDYLSGTVVEHPSLVTIHNVTLANLEQGKRYYFRVQSQNEYGIVTSKVYAFDL